MRRNLYLIVAAAVLVAACGGSQPAPTPAPAPPPVDSTAIKEQMRRDSIAAAERARAEAERRAAEERARMEARVTAEMTSAMQAMIHFDFDRSDIKAEDQATLNRKAAILQANQGLRVRIAGHCDERGSDEYNLALGNRRAAAAKRYLVSRGVAADRIEIVSFGEERPMAMGHDEDAWTQNRRDEFEIVAGGDRLVAPN